MNNKTLKIYLPFAIGLGSFLDEKQIFYDTCGNLDNDMLYIVAIDSPTQAWKLAIEFTEWKLKNL